MAAARNLLRFSLRFEPHENTHGEKLEMHVWIFAQYEAGIEK